MYQSKASTFLCLFRFSDVVDSRPSAFHTGITTEDPDSSSSEESDIECKLSSDEEQPKTEVVKTKHIPNTLKVSNS